MGVRKNPSNYGGLLLRNGTWHMRFSIKGQTVAESTHTSSRRDAERILAKRKAALVEEVVLAGKKPIKLHDAIDLFNKSRAHMKSGQSCEIHLRYFKAAPNHHLDRITDEDLNAVVSAKRAEGYAESTLKVSVGYVNAMLKHVGELGYTTRKKMKPIKHDSGKIRWLTKDELSLLYKELDPALGKDEVVVAQKQENFDLTRLLYETAARFMEVAKMQWNQIDIDKGTVLVRRGKGSITNTISMTAAMREIFERRRKIESGSYVFSSKESQTRAESAWFKAAVKRAKLSEVDGTVTPHVLRHTRAVHLLQGGLGLLELKTFLGHKDIHSTLIYAHVVEQDVMDKVVRITDTK